MSTIISTEGVWVDGILVASTHADSTCQIDPTPINSVMGMSGMSVKHRRYYMRCAETNGYQPRCESGKYSEMCTD